MQLGYTILYVDDVPAALAHYEAAFGLATRFLHESKAYGELETGATTLAFAARALLAQQGKATAAPVRGQPCFEIALTTADVPAALARAVAAGATLVQDAKPMPWGQVVGYVDDRHGFRVELCTPMG
jgi:uncharacterized glyoxalase superfamily protein PhnB